MVRKELRPLLLPWSCALAVGTLFALKPFVEGLDLFQKELVLYGFLAGLALVCSISFGEEFQHRTVSLLLSQPLPRSRVWRQKTIIVGVLVLLAALFEFGWLAAVSWYPGIKPSDALEYSFTGEELLLAAVFLVATVCSCGYWTLVAQSTIGGLVFTISAQLLSALAVGLVVERVGHGTELIASSTTFPSLLIGGLLYSGVFLWLGRRKFLQFEVKGHQAGRTGSLTINWLSRAVDRLGLTSTPDGKLLNLVRKEVHLLKPAFHLAGIFVLTWFGILVLQLARPREPISWLFDWLTCLYAPLTALLGGCLTLGEEKALAIVDTQLMLPLSRAVQWLIKLLSCFCITSILILGLPVLLFWLTGGFLDLNHSGLVGSDRGEIARGMIGLSCFSGIVFCLGFWAITQVPSTVQATLLVVVAGLVFFLLAAFGLWAGENTPGIVFGPLVSVMCRFHLSPDTMAGWCRSSTGTLGWGAAVLVLLILLYQSLRQFRLPTHVTGKLARNGLLLAALILVASFLVANLSNVSGSFGGSEPVQELRSAVYAIATNGLDSPRVRMRVIPPEALLGRVSEQTLRWLKGSQVSYQLTNIRYQRPVETGKGYAGYILVLFPNGVTYVTAGFP